MLVALRELGLSKRTAGMARATLSVILSDAADEGIVTSNPALELGRGRRKRADTQSLRQKAEKVRPLSEEELALFLEVADTKTPRFAAAFWAQGRAGLRPSEAIGRQVAVRKAQNLKRAWTSDLLCIGKTGEPLDLPNMGRALRTVLKTAGISTQHSPPVVRASRPRAASEWRATSTCRRS